MSPVAACGLGTCPVPEPTTADLTRLRTTVIAAGAPLHRVVRVAHSDPTELVPGLGDTRFAPLDGVAHAYVATTTFAAMLESAFHDAAPPAPRIYEAQLALWTERVVQLTADTRLIDFRDGELDRFDIHRAQLVATTAAHYPCTRAWARTLHGRSIGGHMTHGVVWNSRQTELHARALAERPAVRDLLDEHPADVAVLWAPPANTNVLATHGGGLGPLNDGSGRAYVNDLIALLGIVTQ